MCTNFCPKIAVWEITWKCNAKCIHCGSDCVSVEKQNELTTDECLAIIKDLSQIGTEKVAFSGGDPLLRPDLFELAQAVKDYGMEVGFITNGLAIDDAMIEKIIKIAPYSFGISIDSADDYVHDYIRGRKGCFEHAVESLMKLRKHNVNATVVTTVHKLNYYGLPEIRDLLLGIDVRGWQIQYADYIGRMRKETMITEAQYCELAKFIYETQQYLNGRMRVSGADVVGYMNDLSMKINNRWSGCQAGMYVLGLGSDGTVRGCLSQQIDKYIEGNTRERSLVDIWNNPDSFAYNRNFDKACLGGYCKDCKYADVCKGGCTRAATTESDCRCSKYCLYKFEQNGFSDEYQAQTLFSKEEIVSLYNPAKPLPPEFYEKFKPLPILNRF